MENSFTNFEPKKCTLCNSEQYKVLLNIDGKVLRTNNSIIKSKLKKLECSRCGLVRNGINWNEKSLKKYYQKDYDEHIKSNENSVFVTQTGLLERSMVVANWIEKILKPHSNNFSSIIEIGCGSGSLMSNMSKKFPKVNFIGIESNPSAIKMGKKKGLDIRSIDTLKKAQADVVISYAVIEHTPNPTKFLHFISSLVKDNGLILVGQPHQDKLSSDIFYQDHIFHFSTDHIREFGRNSNLVQIKKYYGTKTLSNFSFHIFKKSKKQLSPTKFQFHKTNVKKSIKYYDKIFKKVDQLLEKNRNKKLGIFGTNLFFHIFYTYTKLNSVDIKLGIDDFPSGKKFPFKIISSNDFNPKMVDKILFCANPLYFEFIKNKMSLNSNYFLNPFPTNFR